MSGLDLLISQGALWYMLLVAVLIGVFLGVLCDGLFIIRLALHEPLAMGERRKSAGYAILRGVFDFISVLSATVLLMLLCYYTSDGQLRAPAVFGMTAGFWGYHKTVSRLVRRLMTAVMGALWRFLRFLWSCTVGRLLRATAGAVVGRHRDVMTARRIRALTEKASQGFGVYEENKSD